jgi:hypothetical protein
MKNFHGAFSREHEYQLFLLIYKMSLFLNGFEINGYRIAKQKAILQIKENLFIY